MSGWDALSCRVCLVTNVKLFNLHETGLAELFGLIAGCPVEPMDGFPQYVCYYCYAQLLKFKEFRRKCHKAMVFFRDTGQVIPAKHISFDKTEFCIPLSRTENLVLDYMPGVNNIGVNETDDIKSDNFYSDFIESDNDDVWNEIDEKSDKICEIKNENFENFNIKSETAEESAVAAESSNVFNKEDNIPLNSNNVKKATNVKEATNVKKATNVKAQKPKRKAIDDKIETGNKTKRKPNTRAKKKKCNRYNEKFEEDFEEFSKKYSVKVVCLSKEEQLQKIQERKESDLYKNSRFSCDICYNSFMSESAHLRHMKRHDPVSGAFVCEICQMRYPSKLILNRHARKHKKTFICALCGQLNLSATRAKFHSEWHKGLKFNCKVCQKEFNANSTYLNHKRESHKPVSCADCGETFFGTNELLKHTDRVHGNMKYECYVCAVSFQSPEALHRHSTDNTCVAACKTYPCRHCGATFPYKPKLHAHIVDQHDKAGMFTCEQCGAVFSSDRNLSVHFSYNHTKHVKHHSKRDGQSKHAPQPKPVIRQRATRSPSMKPKRSNQESFSTFLCEICAKSFSCSTTLKAHIQTHSDYKPYPCPMCPKSFRYKTAREVHINVHTGDRPYKCHLCPETFKSYAQRYKHKLLVHTGERRHKCTMCEKTYVIAYDLKEHVRFVHLHHPRPPRKNPRKKANTTTNNTNQQKVDHDDACV